MDSSINPFTGTANDPNSHSNFLANKNSSRNEAVIMGGVMIGAIVFVVLVGVGCMFYRQRARKMKAQQSKDVDDDGRGPSLQFWILVLSRVSLRRFKTTADGANCGME
ncbi:hypothetical protein FCULG_00003668 [Fusarium culmorum]|uniref:Uncharacterized protein n=1 Tax=Fusarium culmorum TaxID=5516 RepID=A0A2T4HAE2_FUSCU|nr:hypothetical protein FCULG_00003668 [Fusarium culmorum]